MTYPNLHCRIQHERNALFAWQGVKDSKYYELVQLMYQWKWDNPDIKQDEIYATNEKKLEAVEKIIAAHQAKIALYTTGPLPNPVGA